MNTIKHFNILVSYKLFSISLPHPSVKKWEASSDGSNFHVNAPNRTVEINASAKHVMGSNSLPCPLPYTLRYQKQYSLSLLSLRNYFHFSQTPPKLLTQSWQKETISSAQTPNFSASLITPFRFVHQNNNL